MTHAPPSFVAHALCLRVVACCLWFCKPWAAPAGRALPRAVLPLVLLLHLPRLAVMPPRAVCAAFRSSDVLSAESRSSRVQRQRDDRDIVLRRYIAGGQGRHAVILRLSDAMAAPAAAACDPPACHPLCQHARFAFNVASVFQSLPILSISFREQNSMPELERFGAGLVQSNRIALSTRTGPAQSPPRPRETRKGRATRD